MVVVADCWGVHERSDCYQVLAIGLVRFEKDVCGLAWTEKYGVYFKGLGVGGDGFHDG